MLHGRAVAQAQNRQMTQCSAENRRPHWLPDTLSPS